MENVIPWDPEFDPDIICSSSRVATSSTGNLFTRATDEYLRSSFLSCSRFNDMAKQKDKQTISKHWFLKSYKCITLRPQNGLYNYSIYRVCALVQILPDFLQASYTSSFLSFLVVSISLGLPLGVEVEESNCFTRPSVSLCPSLCCQFTASPQWIYRWLLFPSSFEATLPEEINSHPENKCKLWLMCKIQIQKISES